MTFVSYAQNYEDVILWRALKHVGQGFYVDIGAHDPVNSSVSLAFYERGWRGAHAEPVPASAANIVAARPDEAVYAAAIGKAGPKIDFFLASNAGLSTGDAGIARSAGDAALAKIEVDCLPLSQILDAQAGHDIHWLKIDVEGMEAEVIASWRPSPVRPWIVVVESTRPMTAEPNFAGWDPDLQALGYGFVYFDGLNRFYVSKEHPELVAAFGPGPNLFDDFVQVRTMRLENALARMHANADRNPRPARLPDFAGGEGRSGPRKKRSAVQKALQAARRDLDALGRAAARLTGGSMGNAGEFAAGGAVTKKPAVVVIGPAWHTGGSYEAMRRQIEICAELGFATFFLAVGHLANMTSRRNAFWRDYLDATANLAVDARACAARSKPLEQHLRFWTDYPAALWRSTAYTASMHIAILNLPTELLDFARQHDIRAIFCNLYFNLPLARKLQKLAPQARIFLETQDVQSYHMRDRKILHPVYKRPSHLEAMLRDEIRISRLAGEMVHYNEDEAALFQKLAPDRRHHLVFPTVPRNHFKAAASPGAVFDFLMVGSQHDANFNSVIWFLDQIWDAGLEGLRTLKIAGNVAQMVAEKSPLHYQTWRDHFLGPVEDLSALYRHARVVLLPVTGGHGIAIKTIEALSFGKTVIATPLAFRGFERHLPDGMRHEIANTAEQFRARLLAVPARGRPKTDARSVALYESLFAPENQLAAYRRILLGGDGDGVQGISPASP